jgi:hypothetical protein
MNKYIAILLLAFSGSAFAAGPVIDVPAIVGKSKSAVSSLIGQPSSCSSTKYGEKCLFPKGETEIVFIKGKADWITVEAIDNVPFNQAALNSIGLKSTKPTFKNDFTLRWSGISGLYEVSIFKGVNNCDYAYIKGFTK